MSVLFDLNKPRELVGVHAQHRTAHARVLGAVGAEGAVTVSEGQLAVAEMVLELLSFIIDWLPVFLARPVDPTAPEVSLEATNDLFGITET